MEATYKMATKAIHQTGDISRATPDLCRVFSEDSDNFIGSWVTGFGFINVKFPKATTRDLTAEEKNYYHGRLFMLGGSVFALNLTGEDFMKQVRVTHTTNGTVYVGVLISLIKVGAPIALSRKDGSVVTTSSVQSIDGNIVTTKNSRYKIEYL